MLMVISFLKILGTVVQMRLRVDLAMFLTRGQLPALIQSRVARATITIRFENLRFVGRRFDCRKSTANR